MEQSEGFSASVLQQLVIYYKNKSHELELSNLLQQIKYNEMVVEKNNEKQKEVERLTKDFSEQNFEDAQKYEMIVDFLKKKIEKYEKENNKVKTKKNISKKINEKK